MSTEIQVQKQEPNQLISAKEIEFAEKVNSVLEITKSIALQQNPIAKGLMQANAMNMISSLLTDELMAPVEKLFGSALGIRTDKKYEKDTMKRIFIEATLGGWGIIGNQINVIGGNLYITKNGYLPRLRNFPGLKFSFPFKHQLPVQDQKHLTWSVTTDIEWELNGDRHKATITNPTKKNEGQSADALFGKADTKCCRWLWNKVTGEDTMDDSGGDEGFTEAEVTSGKVGEGEKINQSEVKTAQQNKSEKGEEIKQMISKEFNDKFDGFISKVSCAKLEDLIGRAKIWCDAPNAKEAGASYKIDGLIFSSETIDLTVFNSLAMKITSQG